MKEKPNIRGRDLIIHFGQKIMGPEFNLNDPLREKYYRNLYQYFAGDSNSRLNLESALFILGDVGVGKSVLLKVMQRIFPYRFYRIEAKEFKTLVRDNGASQTLKDYGYNFRKNLLIDDLGLEDPKLKVWGDQPNILADLFYERHSLYLESHKQLKTHIVTNLGKEELEEYYGTRVLDRIYELCKGNIIAWEGASLRRAWI